MLQHGTPVGLIIFTHRGDGTRSIVVLTEGVLVLVVLTYKVSIGPYLHFLRHFSISIQRIYRQSNGLSVNQMLSIRNHSDRDCFEMLLIGSHEIFYYSVN